MIRLKKCTRNRHHWHSDHASECPWCLMVRQQSQDSFPVTLRSPPQPTSPDPDPVTYPPSPASLQQSSPITLSKRWKMVIAIFLLVVLLIVVPTQSITENVKVTYTEKETYYTQEPYTVEEPYSVQETYSVQEPIKNTAASYITTDAPGMTNWLAGRDISGSHFETDADGLTSDGCKCSVWGLDQKHDPRQVCYQKKCITKSATDYQTVQKSRMVQKFRTVTKYKDVPHIRDVAKTRIEPRQVEVNWILGFKTPWKIHL